MADSKNDSIPPEAVAFASRMFDAARNGQLDVFEQALPAGLSANLTNDKGDGLVGYFDLLLADFFISVPSLTLDMQDNVSLLPRPCIPRISPSQSWR